MLLCLVLHFIYCYAEYHYAECRYAECRYTEYRGAINTTPEAETPWLKAKDLHTYFNIKFVCSIL